MPIRILIAEDDVARDVLAELLVEDGFDVSTARDGQEALRLIETGLPDIVITDLRMPIVSGLDLVRCLRLVSPSIPVIAVSAATGSMDTALDAGANSFFSKPLDYPALIATIRTWFPASVTASASC